MTTKGGHVLSSFSLVSMLKHDMDFEQIHGIFEENDGISIGVIFD